MAYSIAELNKWANSINGQWVDLDYTPKQHIWQCHDILLSYIVNVFGLSVNDGHAPGTEYTDEVWRQFPNHRPNLAKYFTKYHGTNVKAGDIIFWWRYGPVGGLPHVAVALSDVNAQGQVYCVTQNPGKTTHAWLSTNNVLGGLRPITTEFQTGGRPMYAPYWTGPTVAQTKVSGRIITDYGSFGVGNMQLMTLLVRRYQASFSANPDLQQMLDAEHAILDNFLNACFQSRLAGIRWDEKKFASAMTDALKAAGTNIVFENDTELDIELLESTMETVGTRLNAKFMKTLAEKLSK